MNPKVKLDADVTEVQEKMLTLLRTKTKNHWGIQLHLIHVTVEVLIKKHKICPGPPYKVNQKVIDEIRKITAENFRVRHCKCRPFQGSAGGPNTALNPLYYARRNVCVGPRPAARPR
jgi:hypothetical protein